MRPGAASLATVKYMIMISTKSIIHQYKLTIDHLALLLPWGRNTRKINRSPEANIRDRVTREIFYDAATIRALEFNQNYLLVIIYPKRLLFEMFGS